MRKNKTMVLWQCIECAEEGDDDWRKKHDIKYRDSPIKPRYKKEMQEKGA